MDKREPAPTAVEEIPTKASLWRTHRRTILSGGAALVVVIGVFAFVLPRIADYRDVWDVVKTLSWQRILALAGAVVLNLATYAPPWMVALPGLRLRQAFVITQASTASTYVAPGGAAPGVAVSFAMLRGWHFDGGAVALAVTLVGVWNQLAILGFPIIALGLLTSVGESDPLLETVALIGLAVFVAAVGGLAAGLSSDRLAHKVGDLAGRIVNRLLRVIRRGHVDWNGESLARFRRRTIGLLRRRWHLLTLATLAGQLTVFGVLLVSLRVLDVPASDVSLIEAFAAWSVMRVIGSLPITPGGLGVVELGLTSLLVGFGGGQPQVVAAVLVYRVLTIVPTLVLGLLAAATWKRHNPGLVEQEAEAEAKGATP